MRIGKITIYRSNFFGIGITWGNNEGWYFILQIPFLTIDWFGRLDEK
jgi:hypothetical protein